MTDGLVFLGLLVPPLIGAATVLLGRARARHAARINAATLPVSLLTAALAANALAGGRAPFESGDIWRLDSLSALFALLVSGICTLAIWLGPGIHADDDLARARARTFRVYANLFTATMLLAVTTSNLGVMWVAIEATTISSALLIPLHRTAAAVEASWKYLLIGSVGIALAFTGTVLALVDYSSTGGAADLALHWPSLLAAAGTLHPEVARLAFVFLLVGFGTKAGLAPMHTWLPDAHAEAPAPLSAMMSGVLLAVALYAIARWKAVIDLAAGTSFTDTLLIVVAVLTIAVGSLSLFAQRDYKRLLAFSSIEHMGLACFGLALGPAGIFAALLHLAMHAAGKSAAFLLSGRVLARFDSHEIAGAAGLLAAMPATGGLLAAAAIALAGLPPFGLFLSEVLLVRAGWMAGHTVVTGIVLALLLVAFGSLAYHLHRLLFGAPAAGVRIGERVGWSMAILAAPLAVLAWVGVSVPAPVQLLLERAVEVLR
jgi:hydrogenase-4 component F